MHRAYRACQAAGSCIKTGVPLTLKFASHGHSIRLSAQELAVSNSDGAGGKRPAILLLHGSGGNVELWSTQLGAILQGAGVHLYAPHYFERTGTLRADENTLCDGIHVPQWLQTVDDALAYVASRPAVDPKRIIVIGISLGAFLGLALAATLSASTDPAKAARLRAVVDISGGLVPPYEAVATRRFPPTLILHGTADTVVPVAFAQSLTARLTELGVPHRTELLAGEGHWFGASAWPRMLLAVSAFLQPLLT